ncbi:MAG: hypothetical protein OEX19_06830 [Gammaproteobacteria bacterium]|nr:hypothetical protein [Gammaproteobacteria bacterium]
MNSSVRTRPDSKSIIAIAIQFKRNNHRHNNLDSGLGFGILRRSTTYIHVGIRRNDDTRLPEGEGINTGMTIQRFLGERE